MAPSRTTPACVISPPDRYRIRSLSCTASLSRIRRWLPRISRPTKSDCGTRWRLQYRSKRWKPRAYAKQLKPINHSLGLEKLARTASMYRPRLLASSITLPAIIPRSCALAAIVARSSSSRNARSSWSSSKPTTSAPNGCAWQRTIQSSDATRHRAVPLDRLRCSTLLSGDG